MVATPIGNLSDLSPRAQQVLAEVDWVAAEDTRRGGQLLQHFGIRARMLSMHEHNERQQASKLLQRLEAGENIAIISDAGTPLISDPGYPLVSQAQTAGIRVVPVPGPNAAITALSCAGLATDRFVFEGFLPAKTAARKARLLELQAESRTLVFYESSHRIVACIEDMAELFGGHRKAVIARELTKLHETLFANELQTIATWLVSDPNQQKGEFVVIIQGSEEKDKNALDAHAEHVLATLLQQLSTKQAAELAAQITGINKNALYKKALHLRAERNRPETESSSPNHQ